MSALRILVTGSRTWTDRAQIGVALANAVSHCGATSVTVVHGDCPTGADAIANDLAILNGWTVEAHPAQWNTYGKNAGLRRNAAMVGMGADICLAFIQDNSRGATHCQRLAERAGIPVWLFERNSSLGKA